MKLKYRILWIENDEDWVESIEDQIQDYLDDLGFNYEKTLIGKEEVGIDYNLFDLVLMDLNLAEQPNGAELISKIRNLGVYTDVVFYSADGVNKLKTKSGENGLEGVYFSDRTPDTSFIKKVKVVIDSTIKKIQDLSNLRGLVMAEVSELDNRMLLMIDSYFIKKASEEKTKKFKKHLVYDIERNTKNKLNPSNNCDKQCKHKWEEAAIQDLIKDFDFDSSRKARAIKLIIDLETIPYDAKNGNFYEDYRIDMLLMRNNLAHCASTIRDGKEVLIVKNEAVEFDEQSFKDIRNKIKGYNLLFDSIETRIG